MKHAGYSEDDLKGIPGDAVLNAFGCGNPLAFASVEPGEIVLDLGAGAGIDLILAAKRVGSSGRVIGIDMIQEMIAKARDTIKQSGLTNIEVRQGLIEKMPVDSNSVDWVISNCVINLSPEKARVFAEIHRVLRPGGRMLVSDIIAEGLPPELQENAHLHNCCIAGAISEAEYRKGLEDAGLTDVTFGERIVYEDGQISALLRTAFESQEPSGCCSGAAASESDAQKLAEELAQSVWSGKIFARKPV